MERETEDQDDEAGGGGEGDGQCRVGRPGRQRFGAAVQDRDLAVHCGKAAHRPKGQAAISEGNLQHARGSAESGERLGGAEHVDQPASEDARLDRHDGADRAVAVGDEFMADAGDDDAVAVGDQHLASWRPRPGRHQALELSLKPALEARFLGLRAFHPLDPIDEKIGAAFNLLDDIADRLATMIQHLDDRADADGKQKRDDQRRDSTPQSRLGGE